MEDGGNGCMVASHFFGYFGIQNHCHHHPSLPSVLSSALSSERLLFLAATECVCWLSVHQS